MLSQGIIKEFYYSKYLILLPIITYFLGLKVMLILGIGGNVSSPLSSMTSPSNSIFFIDIKHIVKY